MAQVQMTADDSFEQSFSEAFGLHKTGLEIDRCMAILDSLLLSDLCTDAQKARTLALKARYDDAERAKVILDSLEHLFVQSQDTVHLDFAFIKMQQAGIAQYIGDQVLALHLQRRSRDLYEESNRTRNIYYSICLSELAFLRQGNSVFEGTADVYNQAISVLIDIGEGESLLKIRVMMDLAFFYKLDNKFELSEKSYLDAREAALKFRSSNPGYYFGINVDLGQLYAQKGQFKEAETLLIKTIKDYKEVNHLDTLFLANTLHSIAYMYYQNGLYEKSKDYFEEALSFYVYSVGKEHPFYGYTTNNYAGTLRKLDLIEKAKKYYEIAEENLRKNYGENNFNRAVTLGNIGGIYFDLKEHKSAIKYLAKSLKILEHLFSDKNTRVANAYSSLASNYLYLNKLDSAKICLDKAQTIFNRLAGPLNYQNIAFKHLNILYSIRAKDYPLAKKLIKKQVEELKLRIDLAFSHLSEEEKETYLENNISAFMNSMHKLIISDPELYIADLQYEMAMFKKGLMLSSNLETSILAMQSKNEELIINYDRLVDVNKSLAKWYTKSDVDSTKVAMLHSEKENLEKSLADASYAFREEKSRTTLSPAQFRESIGNNEAGIEFVNFKDDNEEIHYAAALAFGEIERKFEYIYLFPEAKLIRQLDDRQERTAAYVDALYSTETRGLKTKEEAINLYELIWRPLETYLEGIETIYYSPVGLLHRLNIGAIAIDEFECLLDKYKLVQTSSTRLTNQEESIFTNKDIFLAGGIDYTLATSEVDNSGTNDDRTPIDEQSWGYLKWTEKESENIKSICEDAGYKVYAVSGSEASEYTFKQLEKNLYSPQVIHLATHGYFFPDPQDEVLKDQLIFKSSPEALLRSGLLLANANHTWTGGSVVENEEDGVLTALEISNMNLSNTELVVLSACETGLGDIEGSEGVYGLQRGFKKAGVKYVINSLWQVPDRETSAFMTSFYKSWIEERLSIPEAFSRTQKEMRDRFFNPYQWAGFVLTK